MYMRACVCAGGRGMPAKNYVLKKSLSNFTLCNGIYENAKLVEQLLQQATMKGGEWESGPGDRGDRGAIALGKCEVSKPLSNNECKC